MSRVLNTTPLRVIYHVCTSTHQYGGGLSSTGWDLL